jgi:hypothetical protein
MIPTYGRNPQSLSQKGFMAQREKEMGSYIYRSGLGGEAVQGRA